MPSDLIDRLAADIREIDGNHDLGAGALAEQLIARGWAKAGELILKCQCGETIALNPVGKVVACPVCAGAESGEALPEGLTIGGKRPSICEPQPETNSRWYIASGEGPSLMNLTSDGIWSRERYPNPGYVYLPTRTAAVEFAASKADLPKIGGRQCYIARADSGRWYVHDNGVGATDIKPRCVLNLSGNWDEKSRPVFHDDALSAYLACIAAERGRATEPAAEPIPSGVYWSDQHDNFYAADSRTGMGMQFFQKWARRCTEFPQGNPESPAEPAAQPPASGCELPTGPGVWFRNTFACLVTRISGGDELHAVYCDTNGYHKWKLAPDLPRGNWRRAAADGEGLGSTAEWARLRTRIGELEAALKEARADIVRSAKRDGYLPDALLGRIDAALEAAKACKAALERIRLTTDPEPTAGQSSCSSHPSPPIIAPDDVK